MILFRAPVAFLSKALNAQSVARIQPIFDQTLQETIAAIKASPGNDGITDLKASASVWLPRKGALSTTFSVRADTEEYIRNCVTQFQHAFCQAIKAGVTVMSVEALNNSVPSQAGPLIYIIRPGHGLGDAGAAPT